MMQKLTSIGALIGVILTIGGGFYTWGQFNTRLDTIEKKDFVINETVDLSGVNQKIADLKVEAIDRINLLEESLMDQDNDTLDVIRNDVAGVSSDIDKVNNNSIDRDKEISNENKSLSTDTWKEFGKTRDLIGELSKLITILQKENELQTIMIEELKASANPLGG
jgi:hypothetical protein|tara:strand:+ start:508 stop:1002 length:495 start_codon:yes stop_codon:yes gene_type:complete